MLPEALCISSEVKQIGVASEVTRPSSCLSPNLLCSERAQERSTKYKKMLSCRETVFTDLVVTNKGQSTHRKSSHLPEVKIVGHNKRGTEN